MLATAGAGCRPTISSTRAAIDANASGAAQFRNISPAARSRVTSIATSLSCTCTAASSNCRSAVMYPLPRAAGTRRTNSACARRFRSFGTTRFTPAPTGYTMYPNR